MSADEQGNDVNLVGIPVTGAIALAPAGTEGPTKIQGAMPGFQLPAAFKRVGLVTQDGGPEFTEERDGDPIQFWQDGYSIPTGLANCTVTFTAAETNRIVQELHSGKEPDENGYVEVNAGGHAKRYVMWLEEIFSNGMIRRRIAYSVTVESFQQVKSERGTVMGYAITLRIGTSSKLNNNHYGQWTLNPKDDSVPAPAITTAAPVSGAAGASVTLTGSNFTGADAVTFGATEATDFTVDSDTKITAKVPAGAAAGSAPIRVSRGFKVSSAVPFTVTA